MRVFMETVSGVVLDRRCSASPLRRSRHFHSSWCWIGCRKTAPSCLRLPERVGTGRCARMPSRCPGLLAWCLSVSVGVAGAGAVVLLETRALSICLVRWQCVTEELHHLFAVLLTGDVIGRAFQTSSATKLCPLQATSLDSSLQLWRGLRCRQAH
jgi:hypothetical protein